MKELLARLSALEIEAKALLANPEAKAEDITAKMEEIRAIKAKIEAQEVLDKNEEDRIEAEAKKNAPVNTPIFAQAKAKEEGLHLFSNLAEQLRAVKDAAVNGVVDERLAKLNKQVANSAAGANEGLPEEGGYVIQSDFATGMLDSAAKAGQILPLVDRYEISGKSNRVEWTDIDETDVSSTVFGGVQVYWASEAAAVTASKPKLKEVEVKLQKLMGLAYATYELDQDSNFISQLYTRAFTLAIQRELENCIIRGNGAGKPLGFLNGGALITAAKEAAQVAGTIKWENIVKMYNRVLDKNSSLVWLMHPDASEQLDFLSFPVGTGGVPVYLPAAQQGSVATLKSKPIVESDHCSALGTAGDINLVDLSQYMLITKGGVQADSSMHVQFLTAENAFRFIFRANGQPKKNKAIKLKNSANLRSSFVTLATRA